MATDRIRSTRKYSKRSEAVAADFAQNVQTQATVGHPRGRAKTLGTGNIVASVSLPYYKPCREHLRSRQHLHAPRRAGTPLHSVGTGPGQSACLARTCPGPNCAVALERTLVEAVPSIGPAKQFWPFYGWLRHRQPAFPRAFFLAELPSDRRLCPAESALLLPKWPGRGLRVRHLPIQWPPS